MNTLVMPGLSGSHPLGAMAAFGLLRIIAIESPFGEAKLAWVLEGDWLAELHVEESVDLDSLIEYLTARQPQRTAAPWLTWHDDIKCPPSHFRDVWQELQNEFANDYSPEGKRLANEHSQFQASYGSEFVLDKKATPDVKPTAFHMTAGQQRFLKTVKELAASLDPEQRATRRQTETDRVTELRSAYETALLGPWTYEDSQHSLGWDPATEGLHALSDKSPSAAGPSSVRAAVWLAFESLPLFPAVPNGKRLHTTGFDANGLHFYWPIWEAAISWETLSALVSSPELYDSPKTAESTQKWRKSLSLRGVRVLMCSRCVRDANGRGTLRNPVGIPC